MNRTATTMPKRHARKRERGAVLTAFVLTSTALFALAAVGVDTGRLALTANEVQTVADAAATAGAHALLDGGSTATARAQAQTVAAQNRVNGNAAAIEAGQLEVGSYDPQTQAFVNGALPANAVRATPAVTVQNLFAGLFGSQFAQTTVTKTATAAFTGLGSGRPNLPLAIGACNFPALSACFNDPSCLPSLTQVPSTTNNTGWTSFLDGSTSNPSIAQYMPSACGGTRTPPDVGVGTSISLNNGQITSVLKAVEDCVKQGINKFTVPVVSCDGNFNQSSTITGFATIIVDSVNSTGSPKGLNLHAIFEEVVGPGGGGTYGTYTVRLFS
jgi:Flp pilus assembly protein TadG